MSGQHAPGPWHWVSSENDEPWSGEYLIEASLRTVAEFGENKTEERDGKTYTSWALPKFILNAEELAGDVDSVANARLIAAAPDLLEALKNVTMWLREIEGLYGEFKGGAAQALIDSDAAIAKATDTTFSARGG